MVRLDEVGKIVTGSTPPKARQDYYGGNFPFVKPGELLQGSVSDSVDHLSDTGSEVADVAPTGSVLVSCIGNLGKTGLATRPVAFNQQINVIIPNNPEHSKWVFYAVQTSDFFSQLAAVSSATTIAIVNKGKFSKLKIPLAPDSEQRRIVAEIEKQFTRLEAGVSALKRVQANLKRYRAAVLKAACSGELVPTEAELCREDLTAKERKEHKNGDQPTPDTRRPTPEFETGAELLERILIERRKNWLESNRQSKSKNRKYREPAAPDTANLPPLPEGWTRASVASLAKLENGDRSKNYPSRSAFVSVGIPFINAGHLERGKVQMSEMNYISEERYALLRAGKTIPGDILFCLRGSLGKVALVANIDRGAIASSLVIVRSFRSSFTPYLLCYLSSWWAHQMIAKYNNGSAQPNLSAADLAKFAVPLPPLAEQMRIVAEVERRLSVVEEMEAVVTANLQRATRLRQSILQKAFEGKLCAHTERN